MQNDWSRWEGLLKQSNAAWQSALEFQARAEKAKQESATALFAVLKSISDSKPGAAGKIFHEGGCIKGVTVTLNDVDITFTIDGETNETIREKTEKLHSTP